MIEPTSLLDFFTARGLTPPVRTATGYNVKGPCFFMLASPLYGIDLLTLHFTSPTPALVQVTLRSDARTASHVQRTVSIEGINFVCLPFPDWAVELEVTTLAPDVFLRDIFGSSFGKGVQQVRHLTRLDTSVIVSDGAKAEFTADGLRLQCPDGTEAIVTTNHAYPPNSIYVEQVSSPSAASITRDGIDSIFFKGTITLHKPGKDAALGRTTIKGSGQGVILYNSGCIFFAETERKSMVVPYGVGDNPAESDSQLNPTFN